MIVEVAGEKIKFPNRCSCELEQYDNRQEERQRRQEEQKIKEAFSLARLGPQFEECTFATFDASITGTEQAYLACRNMARHFQSFLKEGKGLVIYGPVGNGKSHLAAAVVNYIIPQGYTAVFRTVQEVFRRIQESWQDDSAISERKVISALTDSDLLVLDDAAAEKWTEWREEMLYHIINERYRWKAPVIVTSNLSPSKLKKHVGDRTMSRLIERCNFIENWAGDYRIKGRKGKNNDFS